MNSPFSINYLFNQVIALCIAVWASYTVVSMYATHNPSYNTQVITIHVSLAQQARQVDELRMAILVIKLMQ